ncbi:uncharacterized protein [Prorops nasuta]|uniref:uncharacterized protein isoform X2 n=1 Tax=Prorops nasuta TaxID=863751 RepID=UPI0034CD279B
MMNVYDDINKHTQIAQLNDKSPKFHKKKNEKTKQQSIPKARGVFYAYDENDQGNDLSDINKPIFDPRIIANSLKNAIGTIAGSDDNFYDYVRSRQLDKSKYDSVEKSKECKSRVNDFKTDTISNPDGNNSLQAVSDVLRRCKLHKNCAIQSLLKHNIISINDLEIPDESSSQYTVNSYYSDISRNNLNLVEHPEDPDILINEILAYGGIDQTKHKDLDFTVDYVERRLQKINEINYRLVS